MSTQNAKEIGRQLENLVTFLDLPKDANGREPHTLTYTRRISGAAFYKSRFVPRCNVLLCYASLARHSFRSYLTGYKPSRFVEWKYRKMIDCFRIFQHHRDVTQYKSINLPLLASLYHDFVSLAYFTKKATSKFFTLTSFPQPVTPGKLRAESQNSTFSS